MNKFLRNGGEEGEAHRHWKRKREREREEDGKKIPTFPS